MFQRDNGSCNKPNCKWEHSKSRNHTARPSASVSTLNSKSISKVKEQWTAKKAAKVAVHLLKTYPDVLAWKSDPRADGARSTKSNASETPNGKVTNAHPSVTSHRNADAMTRQMEKLYSVNHSQGDGPAETRLVHNGNDSMQVSLQRQMAATPTGRHIVQVLEHSTPEDGKQMRRTESEPHELDNVHRNGSPETTSDGCW